MDLARPNITSVELRPAVPARRGSLLGKSRKQLVIRRSALTLVELLAVIAIVCLLAALLLPAVQASRETGRRMECQNNLKQLGGAVALFHNTRGRFPPGQMFGDFGSGPDSRAWSWLAAVMPYAEQENIYQAGGIPDQKLDESAASAMQIPVFLCASDGFSHQGPRTDAGHLGTLPVGQTNYKAVCGSNWGADASLGLAHIGTDWPHKSRDGSYDGQDYGDGVMFRSDWRVWQAMSKVTDGMSNTLMIGEDLPEKDRWCSWPYANNAYATCAIPPNVTPIVGHNYSPGFWPNVLGFRSRHPHGLNFAIADGSVRFVNTDVSLRVYRAMATIAGNEHAGLE